jgi:Queuosine biosynthesis protein
MAAPTAGLHITRALLAALAARGIGPTMLTLHVGPGIFLPVKTADPRDHKMHAKWGVLSAGQRDVSQRRGMPAGVAVGTTSLRLLESAAAENGEVRPLTMRARSMRVTGRRRRGHRRLPYYDAVHGSITVRPQPANPPVSRVAMLAPAASAVAAISASNFSIGLPACRRASTISG